MAGKLRGAFLGFKRKLTAIFSADVVGYSRLMGADEESTVKILEDYKGAMFTLIKQHRGRVVDSHRCNLLAEFVSVVDAGQLYQTAVVGSVVCAAGFTMLARMTPAMAIPRPVQ